MQLGKADADGRRKVEPVPGSEFVIEADHVVIAIGQEPNTPVLNIKGLAIGNDSVVTADPLTWKLISPGYLPEVILSPVLILLLMLWRPDCGRQNLLIDMLKDMI